MLVLNHFHGIVSNYLSSFARSFDSRRLSPAGNGGGEDDGPGDVDFCRDDLREPLEGVL
jgi:hypothetical protein